VEGSNILIKRLNLDFHEGISADKGQKIAWGGVMLKTKFGKKKLETWEGKNRTYHGGRSM